MTKWASRITDAQMRLARRFEAAKLTTISQAVKAFEKNNNAQIEQWKAALDKPVEQEPEEKRAYLGQRCHREGIGFGQIIVLEYRSMAGESYPFAKVEHDNGAFQWHPVSKLELI